MNSVAEVDNGEQSNDNGHDDTTDDVESDEQPVVPELSRGSPLQGHGVGRGSNPELGLAVHYAVSVLAYVGRGQGPHLG